MNYTMIGPSELWGRGVNALPPDLGRSGYTIPTIIQEVNRMVFRTKKKSSY